MILCIIFGCPCFTILGVLLGIAGARIESPFLASIVGIVISTVLFVLFFHVLLAKTSPIRSEFPPLLWVPICAGGSLMSGLGALFSRKVPQLSIKILGPCLVSAAVIVGYLVKVYSIYSVVPK
jgi:hypothetical protein